MVYLLYDFVILLVAMCTLPYLGLKQVFVRSSSYSIRERFGLYANEQLTSLKNKKIVWIHAASVGETKVALLLARKIKKDYPRYTIVTTNMTETGLKVSQDDKDIDVSILFPIDLSFIVERLIRSVKPELIIIVETEIWPNFTRIAHKHKVPLIMVNGRISDRSFPRYRFVRFLLRPILDCFTFFCMQSQTDMERIVTLGAPSRRVENTGNLKFDYDLVDVSSEQLLELKQQYNLPEQTAIMVAGSTHEKEERQLLEAYRLISVGLEQPFILVIIPRHPARKPEIELLLKELDFKYQVRSTMSENGENVLPGEVLLIDTIGEVLDLYSVADLVFVGGSLVAVGGHNLLEAALVSKPVIFGPHVHNFKEIAKKLIRSGAGIRVSSQQSLARKCIMMLNDLPRCKAMGQAGSTLILENGGATERTMKHIGRCLDS